MDTQTNRTGMLNGCFALDLTDDKGFFCGKILADLGVGVVKVEQPGGDPSRSVGPFWQAWANMSSS